MRHRAAYPWLLRGVHLGVPFAIRRAAVRRAGAAGAAGPLDHYDQATCGLALLTGRPGAAVGAVAILAVRTLAPQHPARVAAVAAAEEQVWRSTPGDRIGAPTGVAGVAGVVEVSGFALLHAPAAPRSWPYHLLTGAVLSATARRHGVSAATALHVVHNLLVGRRAQARHPEPAAVELPCADAWPAPVRVS